MNKFLLVRCLQNPQFARLYAAQTVSLLGDAFTWVGLALLAFELAGKDSAGILATALTLRVTAIVLFAPLAGAIADRLERKRIMVLTHIIRMIIVALLPLISQVWQVYLLIFSLNVGNAFFTPTYQATIPLVAGKEDYPQAIALSNATYQLISTIGPGIAGVVAGKIGIRQVFWLDALSFGLAAILIFTLPSQLQVVSRSPVMTNQKTWSDMQNGTIYLFSDTPIRYGLLMQLVAAIAGAQILVNSVGYVQGILKLGNTEYGWVMASFGIGATVAAAMIGGLGANFPRTKIILGGAILISVVLLPANYANLPSLIGLWLLAGWGQNSVNLPTQTLIADRIPTDKQGKVYGAHFAWSHFWWLFSYPLAGWLGRNFSDKEFLYAGVIGLTLLIGVQLVFAPKGANAQVEKQAGK